jgi:hypothetical protein
MMTALMMLFLGGTPEQPRTWHALIIGNNTSAAALAINVAFVVADPLFNFASGRPRLSISGTVVPGGAPMTVGVAF